ncbi:MAG TPA: aminomethyltransferase family protein [Elusimicrobiota bacterium]|jgi:aminomethyltransferase|nr:aminomethyltransferase family protein [Elusimicrobiota bacterium]
MPVPTPFHPRTSALCTSYRWKQWAGYYSVCSYDVTHEREYNAYRQSAGLLDVTPLFKYEVKGKDAAPFLARVLTKDARKVKVGQVAYVCWTDDKGKILDDGTITRIAEDHFRMTAALPTYYWLLKNSRGFQVTVEDVSDKIATLALQGPNSREILRKASDADMDKLGFFKTTACRMDGFEARITRTGYTGDLGYEVWVKNDDALKLWDRLMDAGKPYGIEPAGLDALDVTRVEAGFILLDVDYFSAKDCIIEARKSTPFEVGLGWTMNLDREPFIGQAPLKAEKERGSKWALVGLEIDWLELEALFLEAGLPPGISASAWRTAVPVFDQNMEQVGQATSGAWSPILKKNLALATVLSEHAAVGTKLRIEATVEYKRQSVTATVVEKPFFNPERKRLLAPAPQGAKPAEAVVSRKPEPVGGRS